MRLGPNQRCQIFSMEPGQNAPRDVLEDGTTSEERQPATDNVSGTRPDLCSVAHFPFRVAFFVLSPEFATAVSRRLSVD